MEKLKTHEPAAKADGPQNITRELRARAALLEQELRELDTIHRDRADAIKREFNAIHEQAKKLYSKHGRLAPQPDVPQKRMEPPSVTRREIEELRNQVQEMRKQMEEWRAVAKKTCRAAKELVSPSQFVEFRESTRSPHRPRVCPPCPP